MYPIGSWVSEKTIYAKIEERWQTIDHLVNNALGSGEINFSIQVERGHAGKSLLNLVHFSLSSAEGEVVK